MQLLAAFPLVTFFHGGSAEAQCCFSWGRVPNSRDVAQHPWPCNMEDAFDPWAVAAAVFSFLSAEEEDSRWRLLVQERREDRADGGCRPLAPPPAFCILRIFVKQLLLYIELNSKSAIKTQKRFSDLLLCIHVGKILDEFPSSSRQFFVRVKGLVGSAQPLSS